MLLWLANLGYAAGGEVAVVVPTRTKGGMTTGKLSAADRARIREMQIRQGIQKDDEEIIAILLLAGKL